METPSLIGRFWRGRRINPGVNQGVAVCFRVRQHAVNESMDDGAVSFDFKVFHFVVIEVLVELFR